MSFAKFGGLAATAFAVLAGCGGTVVTTGGDGSTGSDSGSDSPSSPDSGTDAPPPGTDGGKPTGACPANPPALGATCSPTSLVCEYGSNPDEQCNQIFDCTSTGWNDDTTKGICPVAECPASYAAIATPADQTACTVEGAECVYPSQGTCLCTSDPGGLPLVGGPVWDCIAATPTCPSPRPRLGSPCSSEGSTCDYGACTGGISLECTGGVWQKNTMVACPG